MNILLRLFRPLLWWLPSLVVIGGGIVIMIELWSSGKESSALDYLVVIFAGVIYCVGTLLWKIVRMARNRK